MSGYLKVGLVMISPGGGGRGGGGYQNIVSGHAPYSFPPLRGTNSTTTTNYITGIANFNSNKGSFLTLSSQGLFENIVINLPVCRVWQNSIRSCLCKLVFRSFFHIILFKKLVRVPAILCRLVNLYPNRAYHLWQQLF